MIRAGVAPAARVGVDKQSMSHTHLAFLGCILLLEFSLRSCKLSTHQKAAHVGPEVYSSLFRPDQKMALYRGRIATIA